MDVTLMEAAMYFLEAIKHHVFHLSLEALVLGMYMAVGIVMRFCQKYSSLLLSISCLKACRNGSNGGSSSGTSTIPDSICRRKYGCMYQKEIRNDIRDPNSSSFKAAVVEETATHLENATL